MVDWFSVFYICTYHKKFHRIGAVSICIENVQLIRQVMIAELFSVNVAGADQGAQADKSGVPAVGFVVADHASDLMGFIITAKNSACRNTNGTVKSDSFFHKYVCNSGSEHAAHGTAFHDQSCFQENSSCLINTVQYNFFCKGSKV